MANESTAYGLIPIGLVGSGANTTGTTQYTISATDVNAIYSHGIVGPSATGHIVRSTNTGAATSGKPLGVLVGVEYVDSVQKKPVWLNYWPGSGNLSVDSNYPVKAYVADNPAQLFKVSADASLTDEATARGHVFGNVSLGTSAQGGSTDNGNSTAQLNVASVGATNSLPLRIVGISDEAGNSDFTSAGIPFIVRFNGHYNGVGTTASSGL